MDHDIPADAPKPRLCHIRKRPDFAGYGFNLHAEKGKSGQFIGKVDEGSPAHLAGLREGDRIIEVNGTNVGSENHQQVVQRIKAVADETKFLVLDREADEYYRERKVVVRGDMHNVLVLETPAFHVGGTNGTDSKHRARLCHLKIWPEFTGYGFNLHAEKGKDVQYIGKVDKNSPADLAGLKEHDRIVEVNGVNVSTESHQEVVKRIKSDPKQVTMLVVDKEADAYFEKEGVTVSTHMHHVDRITCPDVQPYFDKDNHHNDVDKMSTDKLKPLHKPRLCHIKERGDGKGFGFNLQAEKGKPGQYIGKVDPGSPAEAAGLRDGDRLVEVNGVNVENSSHEEVVTKIRSNTKETKLLVIEKEGYEHYHAKGVVVTSGMLATSVSRGSSSSSEHSSSADKVEYRPRLCHIKERGDGKGFGFNLQAEKGKPGQFIGKVDPGSPAEVAGLRDGDRLVEVNGANVENISHKDVVVKIKSIPNETTLLVIEKKGYEHYHAKGVVVTAGMLTSVSRTSYSSEHKSSAENGRDEHHHKEGSTSSHKDDDDDDQHILAAAAVAAAVEDEIDDSDDERKSREDVKVDDHNVLAEQGHEHVEKEVTIVSHDGDAHQSVEIREESASTVVKAAVVEAKAEEVVKKVEVEKKLEEKNEHKPDKSALTLNVTAANAKVSTKSSSTTPSTANSIESPKSPVVIGGIEFAGTAEEARRKMSKKRNVKETSMSLKAKYDLFQKL